MTRAEYINRVGPLHFNALARRQLHRQYFAQFVDQRTIDYVVRAITPVRLSLSQDWVNLNDIPLSKWDALCGHVVSPAGSRSPSTAADCPLPLARAFRDVGDSFSIANTVCVAKEAALQWLENPRT